MQIYQFLKIKKTAIDISVLTKFWNFLTFPNFPDSNQTSQTFPWPGKIFIFQTFSPDCGNPAEDVLYRFYMHFNTATISTVFTLSIGTLNTLQYFSCENSMFHYLLIHVCLKYCWTSGLIGLVLSGSTMFAQACLSQYLGLLRYSSIGTDSLMVK